MHDRNFIDCFIAHPNLRKAKEKDLPNINSFKENTFKSGTNLAILILTVENDRSMNGTLEPQLPSHVENLHQLNLDKGSLADNNINDIDNGGKGGVHVEDLLEKENSMLDGRGMMY